MEEMPCPTSRTPPWEIAVPDDRPPTDPYYEGADYDPAVPTLRSVLGFDHGERLCTPEQLERYCRVLSESGPGATLAEYGRSVEGRPLLYLAISTPENLARAEEVKAKLRSLADPRSCGRDAAAEIVASTP